MSDRRRRREGQIWRCNSPNIWWSRSGEEWRINEIQPMASLWSVRSDNIFLLECVASAYIQRVGLTTRVVANHLTTRNNRFSFVGNDDSFAVQVDRPWATRCGSCQATDIVLARRRPTSYACPSCRRLESIDVFE